jgi:hypothetical protein
MTQFPAFIPVSRNESSVNGSVRLNSEPELVLTDTDNRTKQNKSKVLSDDGFLG